MQPDVHERLVMGADRLGDFVFVVRKNEILAAAMDVEGFTEMLLRHGGAFQMPARAAAAPRTGPARLIIGRRFP